MKKVVLLLSLALSFSLANDSELTTKAQLDSRLALKHYKKWCGKGELSACYNLGISYKYKKKEYQKSYKFFDKACKQNHGESCFNIGILYENGEGIKKSDELAKAYFKKSCDLKNQTRMQGL